MDQNSDAAVAALNGRGVDSLPPLAIVLGSGLGPFADEASDAVVVDITLTVCVSAGEVLAEKLLSPP